jgi:CHAT domain-containing protein
MDDLQKHLNYLQDALQVDVILALLQEIMMASTETQRNALFAEHPSLLGDATDSLLARFIQAQTNAQEREIFVQVRTFLRKCREVGPEQTIAALAQISSEPQIPSELWQQANDANALYQGSADKREIDQLVATWERILHHPAFHNTDLDMRIAAINNTGGAYFLRYQQTGEIEDLGRALKYLEEAVRLTPGGSAESPGRLSNLGLALRNYYIQTGDATFLERSLECLRQAVEQPTFSPSDQANHLNHLGMVLLDHYLHTGDLANLDQAIQAGEEAVGLIPLDSPGQASCLNNLGLVLRERYANTGNLDDLKRAIQAWEQAVERTPRSSPHLPAHFNNLGAGLVVHFERTGNLAHLRRAIWAQEQAVELTPPDSPDFPRHLNNLGSSLSGYFDRTEDLTILDRAINAIEQSVRKSPPASFDSPMFLNNLSGVLQSRYEITGNPGDLDKAIQAAQQAVSSVSPSSPERAMFLASLGNGLYGRYLLTKAMSDLDDAIQVYEEVVKQTPPDSPHRSRYLGNLGATLSHRYERTSKATDIIRAIESWKESIQCGSEVAVGSALHSAHNWANWAFNRQDWDDVIQAHQYASQAIGQLLQVQAIRQGKESWLKEIQGLSARVAYALACSNDASGAAVVLEQGQARLLTEALERDQAELATLQRTHPNLYGQYRQAAERMVQVESAEMHPERLAPGFNLAVEAQAARVDLDIAVAAIRRMPGYESFLKPTTFADIRRAVPIQAGVALVYLASTSRGSFSILVTTETAETVWLDFTMADLNALLMKREGDQIVGGYLPGQLMNVGLEEALTEMLPLLGTRIIAPIADRLRELSLNHAVLVPVGLLALLPLHAGLYSVREETVYFLDEFTVTYVPNARALARAQREAQQRNHTPYLVGVGNPLPHPQPLQAAQAELEEIATFFPESERQTFYGAAATKDVLLQTMPAGVYLHFSCHGLFNAESPLDSRLELSAQAPLTLREILYGEAQPIKARLAVLSACQSAISDYAHLPDELIGLPVGFLQAGVPGVVGTLWQVADLSTMLLMIKFYEFHLLGDSKQEQEPMSPSKALRQAQRWLRDINSAELAEYFEAHHQLNRGRQPAFPHMPEVVALAELWPFTLEDPTACPFKNQPYYWAPFIFVGV